MTRGENIAARLREVLLDGHWIANTNYQEQLLSTSWEHAIHKNGNLNSIAALTYHINYYLAGILNVLDDGPLEIQDKYSFDAPTLASEKDWKILITELLTNSEKFITHVEKMSDEKLNETFLQEKYGTYIRNIEGVIEHSYYHLGQISILRKMISENFK